MTLNEYQTKAISTAIYRNTDLYKNDIFYGQIYCVMQLSAEAGEIAAKYAKNIRKGIINFPHEDIEKIKDELGDVLWYLGNLAYELGFSLEEVAKRNNEKLKDRAERGVLHGSGDDR